MLQWSDNMSVGVREIDDQHKELVNMINHLGTAMKSGKGKDELGRVLDGLAAYAVKHFTTEEKYFQRFGYPKTQSHVNEHQAFVGKVTEFIEGFKEGRLAMSVEVMSFLSSWLNTHIMKSDKAYGPFLNEQGVH